MLGNEALTERIVKQAADCSLSHACLICGEKGMGKKTLARMIASEVFCKNRKNGRACGVCPDCRKVMSGNHPDFLWLTHEKPRTISVEEVREQICDAVEIRPYEGGKRIFVIDEAEKMTPQAQNAVLKTLEEPPEYVILLLLAEDERALLDTVRSRCVKIKPAPVETETVKEFLLSSPLGTPVEEEEALAAASFARGNPGKALEFVTGETFKKSYRQAVKLVRNARTMDAAQLAEAAAEVAASDDPEGILELVENWYRDLLVYRTTKSTGGILFLSEESAVKSQGAGIRPEAAAGLIAKIEETGRQFKFMTNKELGLLSLFLEMRDL